MKKFTALLIFFMTGVAHSAVPELQKNISKEILDTKKVAKLSEVKSLLKKPLKERLSQLVKLGPSGYVVLKSIALDEAEANENRWRALSAMAQLGKQDAWPEVERALVDKNWFMRSCALKALTLVDRDKALQWARQLFEKDPALVVRASALEVLHQLNDKSSASILWNKLNDKDSFYQKRSLFIRSHTVKVLKSWAQQTDSSRFITLLDDRDPKVQTFAVMALEKLHGQLGRTSTDPSLKIQLWKNWSSREKSNLLR